MHTKNLQLLIVLCSLVAAGCGQKGPLYLPGDPSAIKTQVPAPQQSQQEEQDEEEEEEPNDE